MTHVRGHRGTRKDRYRKPPTPPVVEDFDDPADRKFLPGGYTIKNDAVIHSYSRPDMRGGGRDLSDRSNGALEPTRSPRRDSKHEVDPQPEYQSSSTITDPLTREEFDELLADKKLIDEAREARLERETQSRYQRPPELIPAQDMSGGMLVGDALLNWIRYGWKEVDPFNRYMTEEEAQVRASDKNLIDVTQKARNWFEANRDYSDGNIKKEQRAGSSVYEYYGRDTENFKSYIVEGVEHWIHKDKWKEADEHYALIPAAQKIVEQAEEVAKTGLGGPGPGTGIGFDPSGFESDSPSPTEDDKKTTFTPFEDIDPGLEGLEEAWDEIADAIDEKADPTVDAKVDADTTVAAVELKGNYGDGVVNPIRRSAYKLPGDPPGSTEEQDAAFIIREVFGLAEGSKRQNPYTLETLEDAFTTHNWSDHDWEGNPPGELDLNPPYMQAPKEGTEERKIFDALVEERKGPFNMAYEGEHKPAIVEWAVDLLMTKYDYSEQEINDLMNAGWAYYNYTAEELAGGGSGPEVPKSPITTPSEPGTLGNGDNIAGNDGNQSGEAKGWARDFREHVAMGTNQLPLAGEAPYWWEGYLPQEVNPDSIHIATMNAILPFLSKADQQALGFHLATALGEGGGLDAYNFIDGSSFYGEESWEDLIYDPTRWQNLFQTLVNLRDYFKDELGPNTVEAQNLMQLDWLVNIVQRAKRMFSAGRMSEDELKQAKRQLQQWFSHAEATGDPNNPNWAEGYGPLLKMIVEPYVSYLESPWKDIQERGGAQELQ